jgi:energy-coupling factor transport system permease protein
LIALKNRTSHKVVFVAVTFLVAEVLAWLIFLAGAAVPVYIVFGSVGLEGLREITRFERNYSVYYRLNPGTKLLALVLVAVSSRFSGVYLGLIATSVILLSYATLLNGKRKLWIGTLLTIGLVWSTIWGSLSDFLPYAISGALDGSLTSQVLFDPFVVRLFAGEFAVSGVFLMALIMVMTSTPSEVMRALRKVRMPNPVTFSLVVGMRTVPLLLEVVNSTIKVQFMRGFGVRGRSWAGPLYVLAAAILALIPSLIFLLRGARSTAISTGTRAFGAYKSRTYVKSPPFGVADIVVIALAATLLAGALLF